MKHQPGLTLIELLAALTTLSVFTAAATAWMTSSARAQTSVEHALTAPITSNRVANLIRDDLDSAIPSTVSVDLATGRLSMITANTINSNAPGWARARWFLDPGKRELIRTTQASDAARPERRVIAWDVDRFSLQGLTPTNTNPTASNWTALRIDLVVENANASLSWERPQ